MNHKGVETLKMTDSNSDVKDFAIETQDYFDLGILPELQMMFDLDAGEREFWLLAEIFLAYLPQKLADVNIAYRSGDWKTLHRLFFDLKSSSAYLGGKYLSRLADVLGRTVSEAGFCSSSQTTHFPGMLAEFEQECDRLQQHLRSGQGESAQDKLD